MSHPLLRGVAAMALVAAAGSASAADLPNRRGVAMAPPIVAPPLFTWTGFYAGLNAGFNLRDNKAATVGNPTFLTLGASVPASLAVGRNGFIGGAQIGYNQQYGMFVAGVETDLQGIGNARRTSAFTGPALGGITTSASTDTTYLGTLRARLGVTPVDRLLVYATGGLAYGNVRNSVAVSAPGAGALWAGGSDTTRFGWTIGGGAEYAFDRNWSAKLEYLYYDLGKRTVTGVPLNAAATGTGAAYVARFENTGQIVRAGVNYKF